MFRLPRRRRRRRHSHSPPPHLQIFAATFFSLNGEKNQTRENKLENKDARSRRLSTRQKVVFLVRWSRLLVCDNRGKYLPPLFTTIPPYSLPFIIICCKFFSPASKFLNNLVVPCILTQHLRTYALLRHNSMYWDSYSD